jgi:uroporphyrinogen-III synthase
VSDGPLKGRRIAIAREGAGAKDLADRIRQLGGEPVICPVITIAAPDELGTVDATLRAHAEHYDWIAFTSANAVHALFDRCEALALSIPARLAAVGPATANAVASRARAPDLIAKEYTAASLAKEMREVGAARVLFPKGDRARDELPRVLRASGTIVDEVVVYRTIPGPGIKTLLALIRSGELAAIVFASPSAVIFTADGEPLPHLFRDSQRPAIFCMGSTTAECLRDHGIEPDGVAEPFTNQGLIDTMSRWFAKRGGDT